MAPTIADILRPVSEAPENGVMAVVKNWRGWSVGRVTPDGYCVGESLPDGYISGVTHFAPLPEG